MLTGRRRQNLRSHLSTLNVLIGENGLYGSVDLDLLHVMVLVLVLVLVVLKHYVGTPSRSRPLRDLYLPVDLDLDLDIYYKSAKNVISRSTCIVDLVPKMTI